MINTQDILDFWFVETNPSAWWWKDADFDQHILERFGEVHTMACCSELYHWRTSAEGRLAEIIILDQFSRNIYRDSPRAFAQDPLALALAQEAVTHGFDKQLTQDSYKHFLYMPYMHSESRAIHVVALTLFTALEIEQTLKAELDHKRIIDRFGRYPHRNAILNRESTQEEIQYLADGKAGF